MVICLERGADLHVAQLMPRPPRVVPEKGPLNGCVCVCAAFQVFQSYLAFCGIGMHNAQMYEQLALENRRNQVLI